MSNESSTSLPLSNSLPLVEMDFHELISLPVTEMDDQQLKALISTCQEQRTIPTVRASRARAQSDKLQGKARKGKLKLEFSDEELF